MINNAFFVDTFLKTHLGWWAYPLGAVIWIVLAFFAFIILGYWEKFPELEKQTCREGGKAPYSIGPAAPFALSFIVAVCGAFKVAWVLRGMRGATHYGIDVSRFTECASPFGGSFQMPAELAAAFGVFAKYWYVPVALCLVSALLRIRIFKSFGAGMKYLADQLLAAHAIYWLYGLVLGFAIMPAPVGIIGAISDCKVLMFILLLLWKIALVCIGFILMGVLAAMPFFTGSRLFQLIEAKLFYRNPWERHGLVWLPVAGSAIVAAVAAIPVGWRCFWMDGANQLGFFSGQKAAWTATVLNWSWTFLLPQGTVEVYSRMHWEIPIILSAAAFVLRIWVFKGVFSAIAQFVVFTILAYATAAFFGPYYAVVSLVAFFGFFLGLILSAKFGGHTFAGAIFGDPLTNADPREKEQEEQRRQEEEYNRTHKTLDDGTWGGIEIEDHGIFGWSDSAGNKYTENIDGTFSPEN